MPIESSIVVISGTEETYLVAKREAFSQVTVTQGGFLELDVQCLDKYGIKTGPAAVLDVAVRITSDLLPAVLPDLQVGNDGLVQIRGKSNYILGLHKLVGYLVGFNFKAEKLHGFGTEKCSIMPWHYWHLIFRSAVQHNIMPRYLMPNLISQRIGHWLAPSMHQQLVPTK